MWATGAVVPRQAFLPGWCQLVLPVHLLFLTPLLGYVGTIAEDAHCLNKNVTHAEWLLQTKVIVWNVKT